MNYQEFQELFDYCINKDEEITELTKRIEKLESILKSNNIFFKSGLRDENE